MVITRTFATKFGLPVFRCKECREWTLVPKLHAWRRNCHVW